MIWRRWLLGLTFATGLVWFTGPCYLDSILVRDFNPTLGQVTLAPGQRILWRSEGCGTSDTGALGIPGLPIHLHPKNRGRSCIILWGDSQVEGFCVADRFKLSNLLMDRLKESGLDVDVIPQGRSGASAVDWAAELPSATTLWKPDLHLWFVAEFEDLIALTTQTERQEPRASPNFVRFLANVRGEAFFHAAKNALFEPSTVRLRKLRWQVGPVGVEPVGLGPTEKEPSSKSTPTSTTIANLISRFKAIQSETQAPIVIVYAPTVPSISGGVVERDPHADSIKVFKDAFNVDGLWLIDLTEDLSAHYHRTGKLPRGFHNGFPGLGHLNAAANEMIAEVIEKELLVHTALVKGPP